MKRGKTRVAGMQKRYCIVACPFVLYFKLKPAPQDNVLVSLAPKDCFRYLSDHVSQFYKPSGIMYLQDYVVGKVAEKDGWLLVLKHNFYRQATFQVLAPRRALGSTN